MIKNLQSRPTTVTYGVRWKNAEGPLHPGKRRTWWKVGDLELMCWCESMWESPTVCVGILKQLETNLWIKAMWRQQHLWRSKNEPFFPVPFPFHFAAWVIIHTHPELCSPNWLGLHLFKLTLSATCPFWCKHRRVRRTEGRTWYMLKVQVFIIYILFLCNLKRYLCFW